MLRGVVPKINVHFHSDRECAGLGQIDQDLDHVDIGLIALPARAAGGLDKGGNEGDLASEFASSKRIGTDRYRLSNLDLSEVALIELRAHPQR